MLPGSSTRPYGLRPAGVDSSDRFAEDFGSGQRGSAALPPSSSPDQRASRRSIAWGTSAIDQMNDHIVNGPADAQRRRLPPISCETFQVQKQLPTLQVHGAPDRFSIVHVGLARRADGLDTGASCAPVQDCPWTLTSSNVTAIGRYRLLRESR